MVLADPQIMHEHRLSLLSTIPLPLQHLKGSINETQTYHIEDLRCSENAWLVFNTNRVIKILRPYNDRRYLLKELRNRHLCLLEGLNWNRKFTQDVHLGLARFCGLNLVNRTITLGETLANPNLSDLAPEAEYALVMNKLPREDRLDMLLKNEPAIQKKYTNILTQFICHVHASSDFPPVNPDNERRWGSIGQLQNKLIINLKTVEEPDITNKAILHSPEYQSLLRTCALLKKKLLPIFVNRDYGEFQDYFTQRVEKQQIKRCHGDLKARNIWIIPASDDCPDAEVWDGVRVLDAVDFNPDFCNIDTLSDFAMLVADVYARTNSPDLAYSMIENYLDQTQQQDKASRFVLNYYLIEKAFVSALVSIMYDSLPKLGWMYLDVSEHYLQELLLRKSL